jgi:hypothetical protein
MYDREVPLEMRAEGGGGPGERRELVGSMESIKVKILTLGDEHTLHQIRVELTSENDLFFHFTHSLEESVYQEVQEHQKLMASFNEYVRAPTFQGGPLSSHSTGYTLHSAWS